MKKIRQKYANLSGLLYFFVGIFSLGLTLWGLNYSNIYFDVQSHASNSGNNYYVDPTYGLDANIGTSGAPFASIQKAASIAIPGDIVYLKPGKYTEKIALTGKRGLATAPIRFVGESKNPTEYPIFDGGDPNYQSTAENQIMILRGCAWLTFERIRFINSSIDTVKVDSSHYITFRRNIIDYHKRGILLTGNASHILVEYNEFMQNYPTNSTWTSLKSSKWEGGAFVSFGGAGMNIIRYNYFHDMFNAIYMSRPSSGGTSATDANVWIYRNRFERIVDDPYEPESYAFNNHFFNNTLINTHRMLSVAPPAGSTLTGPIFVYNNIQIINSDPTKEATTGRINSALKVDLNTAFYTNGVYVFNNSLEATSPLVNGRGIDLLNATVNNFNHLNNVYRVGQPALTKSTLTLKNSIIDYDLSSGSLGYSEPHGIVNTDPGFANPAAEDLRLVSNALVGKSTAVIAPLGFTDNKVITAGQDLGAYQSGASDFRTTPNPLYVMPPSGEAPGFPANVEWPLDDQGGVNPSINPSWQVTLVTPNPSTIATSTPIPSPSSTSSPIPSVGPVTTNTEFSPLADTYVDARRTGTNYGSKSTLMVDNHPTITYLKFDTTSLAGTIPKSVDIKFKIVNSAGSSTQTFNLMSDNSWLEKTVNYSNRPTNVVSALATFQGGRWGTTNAVRLSDMGLFIGKVFTIQIASMGTDNFGISSRESSSPAKLIVTY